jgi:D-alanyl-D-alanine carboxypeptidase
MTSSAPPIPSPGARRRRRPGRLPIGVVVIVAGLTILGVGVGRTATGLGAGDGPGALAVTSARPESSSSQSPSAPPDVGPPGASAGPSASSSPGASSAPVASGGPTGPTPEQIRLAVLGVRLQAELDRVRAKLAIPGVSVTILLPGGASWSGVSGLSDVRARTPVAPDTVFAFASISKTYTSALILQLAAQGRLRLSDPAVDHLPKLRLAVDRRITVAMLLNHTSGLADYFLNPKIDRPLQSRPSATWTVDQTLGYVGKRLSPPGRAWHYSNTNYLLLGLIAEQITGQPLADAIETRLLGPAGLSSTYLQTGVTPTGDLAHGYRFVGTKITAKPIDLADGSGFAPFRSVVTAAGGAGAMAGTSADLARWARALYGGDILGPVGTGELLSSFTPTTGYVRGVAYGYGVQAVSIDGHPSLGHSGRLLGFRGAVRTFPIEGITIAVLTNQSRADPAVIVRALLAVVLPPPPVCVNCPLQP